MYTRKRAVELKQRRVKMKLFSPFASSLLFGRAVFCVVLLGITILINKFSAQTGGHGIILKLLWCLALFWFCFYTSNDLWNRQKSTEPVWGNGRKVCKCRRKLMTKWFFNEITIDKSWTLWCGWKMFYGFLNHFSDN